MNTIEHLLTCLSEECAEVSQVASKALRFGLDDRNVQNPTGPTNRERLVFELNDLLGLTNMLVDAGILKPCWRDGYMQKVKAQRVQRFMKYAEDKGALQPNPLRANSRKKISSRSSNRQLPTNRGRRLRSPRSTQGK